MEPRSGCGPPNLTGLLEGSQAPRSPPPGSSARLPAPRHRELTLLFDSGNLRADFIECVLKAKGVTDDPQATLVPCPRRSLAPGRTALASRRRADRSAGVP